MTSEDDNGRELDAGSADYGELSICPDDYPLEEPCTPAETMLDRSMRTADQALRCYIEEYGEEAAQRTCHLDRREPRTNSSQTVGYPRPHR